MNAATRLRGSTRGEPAAKPKHQLIEFPPPALQVYAEASGHHTIFCCPHTFGSAGGGRITSTTVTLHDHEVLLEYQALLSTVNVLPQRHERIGRRASVSVALLVIVPNSRPGGVTTGQSPVADKDGQLGGREQA